MSLWKLKYHDSIQARLLVAVALLTFSALAIGLTSWYWLSHSNRILEELHTSTIQQVGRSHELTKQSAVFTASATFLLNLKSPYLVETEGSKLLNSIDDAIALWEQGSLIGVAGKIAPQPILFQLRQMRSHISLLISSVGEISSYEDASRIITQKLAASERQLKDRLPKSRSSSHREAIRQVQISTQLLITASQEASLLSLGEYRRRIEKNYASFPFEGRHIEETLALQEIYKLAVGDQGLFQIRRKLLQSNVEARRALSGVSSSANQLNILVLDLIERSEAEISKQRETTSKNIRAALGFVAILGIGSIVMALLAAFYISGYVVKNLNTVTQAMSALARSDFIERDDSKNLPLDEIGRLKEAFEVFRANAIKLKRLNAQLEQKTALFESTFNNINDGVAITDSRSRVLAYNSRLNYVMSILSSDLVISTDGVLDDSTLVFPGSINQFDVSDESQSYREVRNELGQSIEIRTSKLPDGGKVWLFSDTTERRRIEERLSHFQRLESLGQLTGEVAHDFNNVLSAIKTAVQLAISKEETTFRETELYRIDDAVDIGTALTQRLLAFAKKQNLDPTRVELNELISGVSELISLSIGQRIQLNVMHSDQAIDVFIDRIQLESALLNLCINSANATTDEGVIEISISKDQEQCPSISVKDFGCGMSEASLAHAIEPFYSTNRGRNGSGLGLSIVYGFLKQSGGDLIIESEEGQGTTVKMVFARYSKEPTSLSEQLANSGHGRPSVLLVEDDQESRIRAGEYLGELGIKYNDVAAYFNAMQMLESDQIFSVLFTDIHLGGKQTGWDLARYCLKRRLVEKIVITSGRSQELKNPPEDLLGHIKLLPKPYTRNDVHAVLK